MKSESFADKADLVIGYKIIEKDGITAEGTKLFALEQATDKHAGKTIPLS